MLAAGSEVVSKFLHSNSTLSDLSGKKVDVLHPQRREPLIRAAEAHQKATEGGVNFAVVQIAVSMHPLSPFNLPKPQSIRLSHPLMYRTHAKLGVTRSLCLSDGDKTHMVAPSWPSSNL